jgi:hypothetical protein
MKSLNNLPPKGDEMCKICLEGKQAVSIYNICSGRAPKKWESYPEVAKQRPNMKNAEISLQRIDGTNIVIWNYRTQVYWFPVGEPVLIIDTKED